MISDVCHGVEWEKGGIKATHLTVLDCMNPKAYSNSEILLNPRDVHPMIKHP